MTWRACVNSACATSNSARVRDKGGAYGRTAIDRRPTRVHTEYSTAHFSRYCKPSALRPEAWLSSLSQLDTLRRIRHRFVLQKGIVVGFESRFARAFTVVNIEREVPAASGVYGISNAKNWLFIDESDDIRASLMGYLANSNSSPVDQPSGFSFELSPSYSRTARRDRLIAELAPLQTPGDALAPTVARRRSRD